MKKHSSRHIDSNLEHIWQEVPPNYYQNGIKKNILQHVWHTGKLRMTRSLIQSIHNQPKKILDIGCASGWFLSELSKFYPQAHCTGIDVYEEAIQYGKTWYSNLKLIHADAHALPFKKNSFDILICNEVLEHVLDPEKVLKEIQRVLRPGGYAVIEMDTGNMLFRFVWFWWTHARHGVWEHAHIQVFNTQKLQQLITRNGFQIKKRVIFNLSMAVIFLVYKN